MRVFFLAVKCLECNKWHFGEIGGGENVPAAVKRLRESCEGVTVFDALWSGQYDSEVEAVAAYLRGATGADQFRNLPVFGMAEVLPEDRLGDVVMAWNPEVSDD